MNRQIEKYMKSTNKGEGFDVRVSDSIIDEQNDQWPLGLIQPEKWENVGDSLDPLFTIYLNFAEEEDKNMSECWKKDADSIIIFICLEVDFMYLWGLIKELNRLVYSLLSLLHSSLYQSKTFDQILRIDPHSI